MCLDDLLSWASRARKLRGRKPAQVLEGRPPHKCLCVTYRDVGDERLGGVGQHRGGPHDCVAGAHRLHIHVGRVGAADSLVGHVLGVGRPRGQGLEGGRGGLGEPARAQGPLLRHCGGRDLHVKAGRTCGKEAVTELPVTPRPGAGRRPGPRGALTHCGVGRQGLVGQHHLEGGRKMGHRVQPPPASRLQEARPEGPRATEEADGGQEPPSSEQAPAPRPNQHHLYFPGGGCFP